MIRIISNLNFALIFSLSLVFFTSCNDDDDNTPTATGDIVAVATSSNYSSLVAALKKAELDDDLMGTGPFTVFAPTNAAFTQLFTDLGVNGLDDLTKEQLVPILLYHVVAGKVLSTGLPSDSAATLNGQKILITASDLKINASSTIVTPIDVEASNGIIHTIDKVLIPAEEVAEDNSISALAQATSDLSTLVAALTKAELVETFSGEGTFTVFAPTNQAFIDAGIDLDAVSKDDLTNILKYHVLSTKVASTSLSNSFVATLNGESVEVNIDNGAKINDATVSTADIEADNGIIHIIDKVLLPATKDIVDLASATSDLSTLVSLLSSYPDLVASLSDDEGDFTVFAPTNDAFSEISAVTATLTTEQIKEVLQYHVLAGRVFSTDLTDGMEAEMLNGEKITVNIGTGVTISDKDATNTDATVSGANVQAINGVVHIIDKVLIPEL